MELDDYQDLDARFDEPWRGIRAELRKRFGGVPRRTIRIWIREAEPDALRKMILTWLVAHSTNELMAVQMVASRPRREIEWLIQFKLGVATRMGRALSELMLKELRKADGGS